MTFNKLINYKIAVKRIMKKCNISEKQFQELLEKGEISVLAKHPLSGNIVPFKIKKIHEDGKVEGDFIQ